MEGVGIDFVRHLGAQSVSCSRILPPAGQCLCLAWAAGSESDGPLRRVAEAGSLSGRTSLRKCAEKGNFVARKKWSGSLEAKKREAVRAGRLCLARLEKEPLGIDVPSASFHPPPPPIPPTHLLTPSYSKKATPGTPAAPANPPPPHLLLSYLPPPFYSSSFHPNPSHQFINHLASQSSVPTSTYRLRYF